MFKRTFDAVVINGKPLHLKFHSQDNFKAAMLYQMLSCLLVIWSALNVQCEELVSKQPFIYNINDIAKVNFFTKDAWSYVGCMKFCQKLGGRSPPVRTKEELDEMKGMLADLRAFPPYPVKCRLT